MEQEKEESVEDILSRSVFVEYLHKSYHDKNLFKIRPFYSKRFGDNSIQAFVWMGDGYEITFSSLEATKFCLENGVQVDDRNYDAISLLSSDLLVTIHYVPRYVEDAAIVEKLTEMGCIVVGNVKKVVPMGVDVRRRKVVVRLPPDRESLPKSIYFRSTVGKDKKLDVSHRKYIRNIPALIGSSL